MRYIVKESWNIISKFDFGVEREIFWCVIIYYERERERERERDFKNQKIKIWNGYEKLIINDDSIYSHNFFSFG